MKRRNLLKAGAGLAAVGAAAGTRMGAAAPAPPDRPRRHEGVLANGTTWIADVPRGWNGTLIVYSHGYRPPAFFDTNEPQNAPGSQVRDALLERGYALAGSSYSRLGWAMDTAVEDQLATVAAVEARMGKSARRIAFGTSMGAIVTSRMVAAGGFAGALTACGALAGGRGIVDNQLHGDTVLRELLLSAPDRPPVVGFTDLKQAEESAAAYTKAVTGALDSPAGLARFALAAALYHLPAGPDGRDTGPDHAARARARARHLQEGLLTQFFASRVDMEAQAGGIVARNVGTDYARLLGRIRGRHEVRALYRAARLDLRADLDRLTTVADVTGDAPARAWLQRTSDTVAALAVPHLSLHTVADEAIPVEHERAYATRVHAAGRSHLLRQAYVRRAGHTEFTTAELVTAVTELTERVDRGDWGSLATPRSLQTTARRLALGKAAFTPFRPAPFAVRP